ncbi:MAG: hypothetical protein IKN55_06380 [Oscillospiraceae bacterium]|nr:hypothetical protein [Oscillospiraceae bacterium]
MKNLKKIAAVLAAMTLSLTAFTACGGDAPAEPTPATEAATEAAAEANTEAETEADTEAEVDDAAAAQAAELLAAISDTVWVGMDAEFNCYALAFGKDEIYFADDMGGEVQGYWDITADASHIFIYSDAELTDEIGGFDWAYNDYSDTMVIKDTVVMKQTDANSFDAAVEELEKMSLAKTVGEALNETYWFGTDSSDNGLVLAMFDNAMVWASIDNEGNPVVESLYWGIDYDTITLYSADYVPVLEMGWDIAEDLSVLHISMGGEFIDMTQTTEDDAAEFIGAAVVLGEIEPGHSGAGAADAEDAGAEASDDLAATLGGTLWAGADDEGVIAGLAFYENGTAGLFALSEDMEPLGNEVQWTIDENSLSLGEDTYTWEMADEKTLVLTDEAGSVTTFAAVEGTEEDLGAAMAALATAE